MANGKNRIVVTELPYMVNKARLIEKIADLVKDKKIDGITVILCGGILVAMPTAMPDVPFTNKFG